MAFNTSGMIRYKTNPNDPGGYDYFDPTSGKVYDQYGMIRDNSQFANSTPAQWQAFANAAQAKGGVADYGDLPAIYNYGDPATWQKQMPGKGRGSAVRGYFQNATPASYLQDLLNYRQGQGPQMALKKSAIVGNKGYSFTEQGYREVPLKDAQGRNLFTTGGQLNYWGSQWLKNNPGAYTPVSGASGMSSNYQQQYPTPTMLPQIAPPPIPQQSPAALMPSPTYQQTSAGGFQTPAPSSGLTTLLGQLLGNRQDPYQMVNSGGLQDQSSITSALQGGPAWQMPSALESTVGYGSPLGNLYQQYQSSFGGGNLLNQLLSQLLMRAMGRANGYM